MTDGTTDREEPTIAVAVAITARARSRPSAVRMLVGPAILVLVLFGLSLLAGFSSGLFVLAYLGYAIALLGVPYTVVALVVGVVGHLRIRPSPPAASLPAAGPAEAPERQTQNFELFSQRLSLVLAVALLLILVAAGILTAEGGRSADAIPLILLLGGPVVAGAVLTIGANVPQLYHRRVIALEKHAVATRTGRWRLIVLSWVLSPLVWVAYSLVTVVALLPAIFGG